MKKSLFIGLLFFLLVSCEKNTIEKSLIDGIFVPTDIGLLNKMYK